MIASFRLFGLILFVCVSKGISYDINITIPLNKPTILRDKQLYGEYITLNRISNLQVNFNETGKNLQFIIFQVHSHLFNVTLYKNVKRKDTSVTGSNLGLHSDNMGVDTFMVQNMHDNVDLKLYIAVHGYSENDPIPGGCNTEFSVPVSPFMKAVYNRDYIYVDAAAANYSDAKCQTSTEAFVKLTFYVMYLPELNFDSDMYFKGIIDMMSLKNLSKKRVIPPTKWNIRRMVSAYPGTGAIFVVVANPIINAVVDEYHYSVYVPTASYACSPLEDNCELLDDMFSQLACASLFFIGIFICFFGHRFFKTNTFFIGFLSGLVVTYILASLVVEDASAILAISMFSGMCIGAARLVYWWICGLPVLSIILSSADVGFLIASLIFYTLSDELEIDLYLNIDINFWTLFILIIASVTIFLLLINSLSNFICCAVVGAYSIVLPFDYFLGSHLKYSMIYIVRRATVVDFHKAVKMQPYQWQDGMLTAFWVCLAVSGFAFQRYQNRGRPPFPPPPRSVRAVPELPAPVVGPSGIMSLNDEERNERTPLLVQK